MHSNDNKDRKSAPFRHLLSGVIFSLTLIFFGFFVLRDTELAFRMAFAPFVIGPFIWPAVFYLSADMRHRARRIVFVALLAVHYIGLAYALCLEETYEWAAYRGVFLYAFPQALIYLWGQFILWRRFGRGMQDGFEKDKGDVS